jgi:hypothetical protein
MPFAKGAKVTPTYFRARTWALELRMKKYLMFIGVFWLCGCASQPEQRFQSADVDFMFNSHEEREFNYPFGEYPKRIIESILERSQSLGVDVKGITAMAWGIHPMAYVVYTEEAAYVSFFYWGNTAGKGYIKGYALSELESMNDAIVSDEKCFPYKEREIDWVDIHLFERNGSYLICEESGAFFGGGEIRGYFGGKFGERIEWEKYSYGT